MRYMATKAKIIPLHPRLGDTCWLGAVVIKQTEEKDSKGRIENYEKL